MNQETANPYQTPEASVETASGGKLSSVFDRFSAWGVFGLLLITLGIYGLYWLYNRTQRLNQHVENPISSTFITTTLVLYVIGILTNFAPLLGIAPEISLALGLAGLVGTIMWFVWLYKLRNRIHDYLSASKEKGNWFGPILTFFFNVIYLQYKINQSIDSE